MFPCNLVQLASLLNDGHGNCPEWRRGKSWSHSCPHQRHLCQDHHKWRKSGNAVRDSGFSVTLNVSEYKSSELTVKINDEFLVVEGKHDEREDEHGLVSRHFIRRYPVPKGHDLDKIVSTISSDGVLTVNIPSVGNVTAERVVEIQETGKPHDAPVEEPPVVENGTKNVEEDTKETTE